VTAERTKITLYGLQILTGTAIRLGMPLVFGMTMNLAVAAMWAALWPVAMHRGLSQLHAGSKTSGNGTGKPKAMIESGRPPRPQMDVTIQYGP